MLQAFLAALDAAALAARSQIVALAGSFLVSLVRGAEVALEDLAQIALGAVLNEAPKLATGQEKFGNAVASVVQQVEARGKTVALQTAQMAVQQAYLTAQSIAHQSVH